MSERSENKDSIDTLAVEIRYLRSDLQDMKAAVSNMNAVITQLQVKSATHATIFGLLGGILTAAGSYVSSKILGS